MGNLHACRMNATTAVAASALVVILVSAFAQTPAGQ